MLIMHLIFFHCHMKIFVAMDNGMLQKHMDHEITQKLFKLA